MSARASLLLALVIVAACGGSTPAAPETPEPAAFNVAAVRQSFTEECVDPIILDELFCEQVEIVGMSADGDILNVPTTLNAASQDRAEAICNLIAFMHFDADAVDLGYKYIGILDQDGGNLAACTVDVSTSAPTPEPEPVGGSGIITFGTAIDEDTLLIPKPLTRFKRTYPEIHWSAEFKEPAGATTLLIVLSRVSSGGAETTVYSEETDVTSPEFDIFSASADLAGIADNKAGTYTLRYIRDDTVLAEGTFTLVK